MFRAIVFGCLLFALALVTGGVAVALIRYFNQYELGLVFPVFGVLAMLFGEKLLQSMEIRLGHGRGGAGAVLIRSVLSALVVVAVPTVAWGAVMASSDFILLGMEAVGVPRDQDAFLTMMHDLRGEPQGARSVR